MKQRRLVIGCMKQAVGNWLQETGSTVGIRLYETDDRQ
jgi:hypothetical protein